jgi:hypothetical protein
MTSNMTTLDRSLKDEFSGYHKAILKNTVAMATRAYEIHCENLSTDGKKYDAKFEDWWKSFGLDEVFGGRSSWTKWHRAGEAIARVKARFDEYSDEMPSARDALYEVAMLDEQELRLCVQDTYTRKSITAPEAEWQRPKNPKPVINPGATAASIRSWRGRWRAPQQPRSDSRNLQFLTIKVDRSLYDFDSATGEFDGRIEPATLGALYNDILNTVEPFRDAVWIDSNLGKLMDEHDKRQLAAADAIGKVSKKKSKKKG